MPSAPFLLSLYKKTCVLILFTAALSACAGSGKAPRSLLHASNSPAGESSSAPQIELQDDSALDEDPLEPLNRFFYGVNFIIDRTLVRPLALAYIAGVPDVVQTGVRNVFRNLKEPVIALNYTLQGNWKDAGHATLRLAVNSTFGLLGIFDVAKGWGLPYHNSGLPYHDNGFDQTLAVYGVGRGPYLYLPIFGPTYARQFFGRGIDTVTDPLGIYLSITGQAALAGARGGAAGLNEIVQMTPLLESLDPEDGYIPYARLRRFYLYDQLERDAQIRASKEKNPTTPTP